jgi:Thrombospondin type 1 domain
MLSYYGTPQKIDKLDSPNISLGDEDMCQFPSNHKTIRMEDRKSAQNFFGYDVKSNLENDPRKMYGYEVPTRGVVGQGTKERSVSAASSSSAIPQTEFICGDVEIIYNEQLVAPTSSAMGGGGGGGGAGYGLGLGGPTNGVWGSGMGGTPTTNPPQVINNYYYGATPIPTVGSPTTPSPFQLLTPAVLRQMDNEQLQNIPIGGFLGLGVTSAPTITVAPPTSSSTNAPPTMNVPILATTTAAPQAPIYTSPPPMSVAPTTTKASVAPTSPQKIGENNNVADNTNVAAPFRMNASMPQQSVPQMIQSNFNPISLPQQQQGGGTAQQGGGGDLSAVPGKPAGLAPVDCQVIGWSNWSPCVAGSTQRVRTQITNGGPYNGGAACPALKTETDNSFCPLDCKIGEWGDWTPCATGSTQRTRKQTTVGPFNGGAPCTNIQTEIDNSTCSVDCQYTGWTEWTACVPGSNKRTRTQTFNGPFNGGAACNPQTETDISTCPMDSTISGWTDWTACQSGSNIRTRTQVTVPPSNNGATVRPIVETDTSTCSLDCQYTGWGEWSKCVPGTNVRTRTQTFTRPLNGGAPCNPQTETDISTCPMDSTASGWGDWSVCVPGSSRRIRTQVTRAPLNNGATIRPLTETDDSYCSVDCKFSMDFSTTDASGGSTSNYMCDISAGGYRNYKVTMVQPAINNGLPCMYEGTVVDTCGQIIPSGDPCPVDSTIAGWGDWSSCVLDDNTRTRTQVTRPAIHNGATVRPQTEMDPSTCPVNCKFGLDFSNNVTCDLATGTNNYTVNKYIPAVNDGSACIFQGTLVTGVGQVVPSNVDCSVNCVASYNGTNSCVDGKYYQTYNVTKTSMNSGNVCTVNDGCYNVIFNASAIGQYSVQVDTCADCSYTLQDLSLTDPAGGCDFATGIKKYKVAQYIPPVRSTNACQYGLTTITGTDQPPFISSFSAEKCPVDCSYSSVNQLVGSSGCVADATGKYTKRFQLNGYIPPKNGGGCNYTNSTTLLKSAVVGLDANSQFTSDETCSNCSYTSTFNKCVGGYKQYITSNYTAATGGGAACTNNITGNGQTYTTNETCNDCTYTSSFNACVGGYRQYKVTSYTAASGGGAACDNNVTYNGQLFTTNETCTNCSGHWSDYGACSASCGGGTQTSSYVIDQNASNGGADCPNRGQTQSQSCNTQACPVNCTYNENYSGCSGGRIKYTSSNYSGAANGGSACPNGVTGNGQTYDKGEGCRITTFTNVGSQSWTSPITGNIMVTVVGGGGGGGGQTIGGGGGGGGVVHKASYPVTAGTTYTVVVGNGGNGGNWIADNWPREDGKQGGNSQFNDIIAYGGGGGSSEGSTRGSFSQQASGYVTGNGGSGGGAGGYDDFYQSGTSGHYTIYPNNPGNPVDSSQGNRGGYLRTGDQYNSAGGGGGAGGVGGDGSTKTENLSLGFYNGPGIDGIGGKGGDGVVDPITGNYVGGGGGGSGAGTWSDVNGDGGLGGGGYGATNGGSNGSPNTGGGGGGGAGGNGAGNGGSGIVIIAY